ncbi:adenosine deaminase/editase [Lasiosphaeria ovina]|uniref:Adenosine deaminase/editase n=1 Tax=Lasiosphaeria ovina TaxID=92902 RepID=A0AAE0N2I9_9PEZI|nr:adenosine deaminase/editase [Lasiosphaeria ovina]
MSPYDADAIVSTVLAEFQKLPAKRKPCVRDNGIHEWVPLSGIVAKGPNFLRCLALATGMKCLPASKLPQVRGMAVHDWHAEVLALRAFNRFVLQECRRLLAADDGEQPRPASEFLRRRTDAELAGGGGGSAGNARGHQQQQQQDEDGEEDQEERTWHRQPFAWRDDVSLHMYCSEAPCGDASMELVMAAQDDASPWALPGARAPLTTTATTTTTTTAKTTETAAKAPPPPLPAELGQPRAAPGGELLGRGYFSELGVVRRKPARGDAPASVSKSCSDKLALKQCTSLLSAVASTLVSPRGVYLATLVLPASRFSAAACARCFSASSELSDRLPPGRMRALAGRRWGASGYAFAPVAVTTTHLEFEFSKRAVAGAGNGQETTMRRTGASNLAVAWTCDGLVEEGLIGGVLQGRKTFDEKGASAVSRRKMWELAVEVAGLLGDDQTIASVLVAGTYDELKDGCPLLAARRRVKEEARAKALQGWLRNEGDGAFGLV